MPTQERIEAAQYLEQPYEIALVRRDGADGAEWWAQVVELPGCEAHGETEEEALASVRGAQVVWIQDAIDGDRPVPAPKAANGHSGRLLVRMPPSLHSELARCADREKVSLNTLIVGLLGGGIGWRQPGESNGAPPVTDVLGPAAVASGRSADDETPPADRSRWLSVALTTNLVVVVVAGLVAIGLMIAIIAG
jgi:predicted RNase H-like HicB family nuclease